MFLTLLIFDGVVIKIWGGGDDILSYVSYVLGGQVDLVRVVFSRWLLGTPITSPKKKKAKKAIRDHERVILWYGQL